jgi:hypothetical protein
MRRAGELVGNFAADRFVPDSAPITAVLMVEFPDSNGHRGGADCFTGQEPSQMKSASGADFFDEIERPMSSSEMNVTSFHTHFIVDRHFLNMGMSNR